MYATDLVFGGSSLRMETVLLQMLTVAVCADRV